MEILRGEQREKEENQIKKIASLALLFAFKRLHQVVLQSLLLRLVSQGLNTPVREEGMREGVRKIKYTLDSKINL